MGLRKWLRKQVGQVPPELEVCEFRCSQTTCRHGDWERCDWRLRGGLPSDLPDANRGPATSRADSSP
jgi:hypothetical protein